jgi:hypothetical protein
MEIKYKIKIKYLHGVPYVHTYDYRIGRIIGKNGRFVKINVSFPTRISSLGPALPNQINKRGITGCGQTSDV